ncbi:site-specific DNA-methyltransferase [Algibacter luteus]|uniref:site-specific DNA-methyltransferase n=1 Tax=Algibacter luteus TaxID=1178825 RepID=UPI00259AE101|nr:site-specific DNA-methyltransferase [Algibacter luteus]WJJ95739.1 site-specific DNA-methyltransferase [Algibacter luteus]
MNKRDIINKIKVLDGLTQDERGYLINLINTRKKYGLVWEDKPEEVEEQLRKQLPILKEVKERAIINESDLNNNPNHILIEGDNLHALTALTFTHKGKIELIYIDPPYNTGNKDFLYNDNFVDKEDAYRHSKWLSFMSKRLQISKELLSDSGKVVISIGYQELHNLLLLVKEVFYGKQVVTITVQTSGGKPSSGFNYLQEYLVYIVNDDFKSKELTFSGGVSRSPFEGLTLSTFSKIQRPNQVYPIFVDKKTGKILGTGPSLTELIRQNKFTEAKENYKYETDSIPDNARAIWPITSKGKNCVWRLVSDRLISDWDKGYIKVTKRKPNINKNEYSIQYLPSGVIDKIEKKELKVIGSEKGLPTLKFGANLTVGGDVPTIWSEKKFFTNKGSTLLRDIIGNSSFPYPKPIDLIKEVILNTVNKGDFILDFFAGSGTTLQAAMEINSLNDENLNVILVTNNENNIAKNVTYERSKSVIQGYTETKGEKVDGLINNNLRYYKTTFVERKPSLRNKRKLTKLATELLCIKEDCYLETTSLLKDQDWHKLFTNNKGKYVYVVYDDVYIEEAVEGLTEFAKRHTLEEKIKVYVFANGQYAYHEEFEEISEIITLAALPEAIYKAYQNVLPKENKEFVPELNEEDTNVELKLDLQ